MRKLQLLVLLLVGGIITALPLWAAENVGFHAKAKLDGKDVVPKVKTKAKVTPISSSARIARK